MDSIVVTSPLAAVNPAPAWAIRVARPAGDGLRMTQELQGVPRLLLQIVFGKALGRRIWEQTRATGAAQPPSSANQVTDTEISSAMLDYVSRRAADTLREHSRQARAIQLKVTYAHGETHVARTLLAGPTGEGTAIAEAAAKLLGRLPASGVQSVNLTVRTAI